MLLNLPKTEAEIFAEAAALLDARPHDMDPTGRQDG